MKQTPKMNRIAIAALSAAILLPTAPVFGQDAPAASPPPVVTVSPPPPAIVAPPPPPVSSAPPPRINVVPQLPVTRAAPPPAAAERPATRTTRAAAPRTAPRPRVAAPARQAAPAPAPAPVAAAPAATPEASAPAAEFAPLPPVVEEPVAVPVETPESGGSLMIWLIAGAALLIAGLVFLALRRRSASDEVDEETYYEEPAVAVAAAPVAEQSLARAEPEIAAAPLFVQPASETPAEAAMAEDATVDEADPADVDALAADSEPVAGRPWLEFLLRPVRAGTSQDDTIVQFELTVGNTGTVAAKDVKISTWMFAAGAAGESQMERMLIEPPADATVSEIDIAAGDGTRVDGEISLPKAGLTDSVLPVVVADARYRLPDGSEGRTSASFAIGLPEGEGIAPFQLDRASGLIESVEARLHGEPQRT